MTTRGNSNCRKNFLQSEEVTEKTPKKEWADLSRGCLSFSWLRCSLQFRQSSFWVETLERRTHRKRLRRRRLKGLPCLLLVRAIPPKPKTRLSARNLRTLARAAKPRRFSKIPPLPR